jgi:hypothetical protein
MRIGVKEKGKRKKEKGKRKKGKREKAKKGVFLFMNLGISRIE